MLSQMHHTLHHSSAARLVFPFSLHWNHLVPASQMTASPSLLSQLDGGLICMRKGETNGDTSIHFYLLMGKHWNVFLFSFQKPYHRLHSFSSSRCVCVFFFLYYSCTLSFQGYMFTPFSFCWGWWWRRKCLVTTELDEQMATRGPQRTFFHLQHTWSSKWIIECLRLSLRLCLLLSHEAGEAEWKKWDEMIRQMAPVKSGSRDSRHSLELSLIFHECIISRVPWSLVRLTLSCVYFEWAHFTFCRSGWRCASHQSTFFVHHLITLSGRRLPWSPCECHYFSERKVTSVTHKSFHHSQLISRKSCSFESEMFRWTCLSLVTLRVHVSISAPFHRVSE